MKLEHFTDRVFTFEHDRTYQQHEPRGFLKPIGLWVSVPFGDDGSDNHDWPAWCRAEEFCLSSLEHVAEVTLADDANILYLPTPESLDAFHDEYSVDDDPVFNARPWAQDQKRYWAIDWRRVAKKYDGLIIAPYHWSRRLDGPMWFYGWDAASGCIWNLAAVASVEVIK